MIEMFGLKELKFRQNVFGAQTQSVQVPRRKYVGKWAQPISEICLRYWVLRWEDSFGMFFWSCGDWVGSLRLIINHYCHGRISIFSTRTCTFKWTVCSSIKHPFAINQQHTNTWKHPLVIFFQKPCIVQKSRLVPIPITDNLVSYRHSSVEIVCLQGPKSDAVSGQQVCGDDSKTNIFDLYIVIFVGYVSYRRFFPNKLYRSTTLRE